MKQFIKERLILLLRLLSASFLTVGGYLISEYSAYISMSLFSVSYIILCYDVLIGAFKELFLRKRIDAKLLMFIATLGAMIIEKFVEASVILIIFLIGEMFKETIVSSCEKTIEILSGLQTDRVRLKDGSVIQAKDAKVDDVIEVYPKEIIAVDGVVVGGIGFVDTSAITGHRKVRGIKQGSKVLAGYVNKDATITVRVTRPLNNSVAKRIVDVLENSFEKKTKIEIAIEKFTKIFIPIVMILSLLVAVVPPLIDMVSNVFGNFGFEFWIYRALGLLIISCPISILVSVQLAYFCGIRYAAKKGILIKGSYVIETLRDAKIFAFDKTGTLTKRELVVTSVDVYDDSYDKFKLLEIAATVELKSHHPVSGAIIALAKRLNVEFSEGENYVEAVGSGIECDSQYGHIKAGSRNYVNAPEGMASIYVSVDGKFIGTIGIGDQLKENSKKVFEKLRKSGVKKKIILSGDKKIKVDQIVKTLLAEAAYSNLKPIEKGPAIEDIKISNPQMKVAYCGNGTSDIASLTNADVGISMDTMGNDEVVNASDVIIMDDNLDNVAKALKIAKKTHVTTVFNIVISIIVKLAIIAMLFIPLIQFKIVFAVLIDVALMIFTTINALLAGR